MRVLITGAAGYVASYVITDLGRDHELTLIGRRHPSEAGRTAPAGATFIRGDLGNPDDCRRAVEGADAIAHIGANNWLSPETFRNNTVGTYNLLEAAREAGIRRVAFASSNCALGHCAPISGPFLPDYLPIDERHPERVEDNYGLSKIVNEQTLAAFARAYGVESYALRLAWCWGEQEHRWRFQAEFDPAKHTGGFWAWVDMRDVAQAFRKALHAPPMPQAACVPLYINAADTMADQPSDELIERFYPQRAADAARLTGHESLFSWQAAQAAIGYTPEHTWRTD
jgi:nucleoside-diphosphate-sugar epimerase